MSDVSTQLKTLLNLVPDQSRLVFFVGAGASVAAGYPLWQTATEQALRQATDKGLEAIATEYAKKKLQQQKYYEVFDILREELPESTFYNIAESVFSGGREPSEIHRLLTRVQCRGIITTNFDTCLEQAAVLENRGLPLQDIAEAVASDKFFVAKPHGSILTPRQMVLCTSDYKRVEANGTYRQLVAQCVSENQFLFMGYSMRDPDFNRMWDEILGERIFRLPAIYCCGPGTIEPTRRDALRERNVQVLEFADDGSFAFMKKVLGSLCGTALTRTSAVIPASRADVAAQELERYVLISLLFSPIHQGRMALVAKALVLEFLIMKGSDSTERDPIVRHVTAVLGQDSAVIQNAADGAIEELVAAKILHLSGTALEIDRKKLRALDQQAAAFDEAELKWINRSLSEQSAVLGEPAATDDSPNVKQLLEQVLMESGKDVAELLLFNRSPGDESSKIDDAVERFCKANCLDGRKILYKKTIKQMILDTAESEEDILFKKLQSYFIASAYVLDPTSEKLLSEYARDHWVYFDSSVILPALAIGHPSHKVYRRILSRSRALGMRLRVIRDMVNEVWANIRSAMDAFKEFGKTVAPMKDVLEGYVAMCGAGNGNVFLEGFVDRLQLDASLSPAAYMSEVLGIDGTGISEARVADAIHRILEIDPDDFGPGEIVEADLEPIISSIEFLRKQANRFKTRRLCEHEARQFYLIHLRRKQNPELRTKIWFITTDRFLVELQRLEREKYPLPISYTPRSWFQYLDIIDSQSRGSSNFARLQPRMRFGVVSGDLGIEAIHTILKEQKNLLSQNIATVKELAEAAVTDFHVQKSIWDYDRKSGSTRDPALAEEAKQQIRSTMKKAVSQFVAVRAQEIETIKDERDSAAAKARSLEKMLAKQRYVNQTLKAREKAKKKGKKKRRR
jgi:NAD-dependent SIR2 family protein deacetylase